MDKGRVNEGPKNVLLVEDESSDRKMVRSLLEIMGFSVYVATTELQAKVIFSQNEFSLVIIHLAKAPLKSLEICQLIRASSTVPVLMFTNRIEIVDEAMILSAGADDYIAKPIDTKILTSRINQQLMRGQSLRASGTTILAWENIELDLSQHFFTINRIPVSLTNTEYQFLQLLLANPHRIFSRIQILQAIGVEDGAGTDHLLDTHASRLRSKIRDNGGPEVIAVIRSVGFRLTNTMATKAS
jgi:DNA-binding response OmpR family regulator